MIQITKCECGHPIETKWNGKLVHVSCEKCKKRYQLDQTSRRKYLAITPLVIIAIIYSNRLFFQMSDLVLLSIYILGLSYVISHGLNMWMVKNGNFTYEREYNQ